MTKKPKQRSESEIQKAILQYLNAQPETFAFKVFSTGIPDFKRQGGFRTNPNAGVADIIGCKGGNFFAMEVKRPGGKLTEKQRGFLMCVNEARGYECVVFSLEDAVQAYSEI
jgi:hypothetical protein